MDKNAIMYRISTEPSGIQLFKALIYHPMENGQRINSASRQPIAEDYIVEVQISVDNEPIIKFLTTGYVSKTPFFAFRIVNPIFNGQNVTVTWLDNHGKRIAYHSICQFDSNGQYTFKSAQHASKIKTISLESKPVCQSRQ